MRSAGDSVPDEPFLGRLVLAHRGQETGVLEVTAEGLCTVIYIRRGVPIFAEEGTLGETLGRLLLRRGVLSDEQHRAIIQRMTDRVFDSEQLRFGEVAVMLGFLNAEQVNGALAEQVRLKLLRCADCVDPVVEFREAGDANRGVSHYPCPVEPLVIEALRRRVDVERAWRLLAPVLSSYVRPVESAAELAPRLRLDGDERLALQRLDATCRLSDYLAAAPDALHVVAGLHLLGLLAWGERPSVVVAPTPVSVALAAKVVAPRAPAAPRAVLTSPQVRNAPVVAGDAEARLRRVARQLAQGGAARAPVGDGRPPAPTAAAAPAPVAPAQPILPRAPQIRHDRLQGEQRFSRGKDALRRGQMKRAVDDLTAAARLHPDAIEYQLYAAWAEYVTLSDPAKRDEQRAALRDLTQRAIRQDKDLAFAHYVNGQLQLQAGDTVAATRAFKTALSLDPSEKDAERQLRVIALKSEA